MIQNAVNSLIGSAGTIAAGFRDNKLSKGLYDVQKSQQALLNYVNNLGGAKNVMQARKRHIEAILGGSIDKRIGELEKQTMRYERGH